MSFYTNVCGFRVAYERPEERFAYLERDGIELMLQDAQGPGRRFRTAPLEPPFGRGMNLQIEVSDVRHLYESVIDAGLMPVIDLERKRYRIDDGWVLTEQFVIADPDGYLLRFFSDR